MASGDSGRHLPVLRNNGVSWVGWFGKGGITDHDNGASAMVRAVRPARRVHGEMAKRGDARDTSPTGLYSG